MYIGDSKLEALPVVKSLKEAYEQLEIEYEIYYERDSMSFVRHYPVLEITNSKDDKHTMYDLFAAIKVSIEYGLSFTGSRTTYTHKEARYAYGHSHLQGIGFGSFGSFCTGDSPMSTYGKEISKNEAISLIYLFDDFVRWESLEGGPYREIANMNNTNLATQRNLSTALRVRFTLDTVEFDIVSTSRTSEIVIDRSWLEKTIPKTCVIGVNGQVCIVTPISSEGSLTHYIDEPYQSHYIYFKGKKYTLKFVEDQDDKEEKTQTFVHHPLILSHYEKLFKTRIETYIKQSSSIIEKIQIEYKQKNMESNSVPMQASI